MALVLVDDQAIRKRLQDVSLLTDQSSDLKLVQEVQLGLILLEIKDRTKD